MNWKLNDNSLFAILLRSPWWISLAIAGAVVAVALALLPDAYRTAGAVAGFPFLVIGCLAARNQLRAPSVARVDRTLAAVRAMSWDEFSGALEEAYRRHGYGVSAIGGAAANFEITKEGRTALVSCKRWKVARTGVGALASLNAMKEARDAHECIYVAAGEITDNARAFAVKHAIRLVSGPELALLLPDEGKSRKAPDQRMAS
jgi:restriction system protein